MPLASERALSRWPDSAALFPFWKKTGCADFISNVGAKKSTSSTKSSSVALCCSSAPGPWRHPPGKPACMFVLLGGAWRGVSVTFTPSHGAHTVHGECWLICGWWAGAARVGVGKGAEGGLRALAARTYPGWLQVGMGRGLQPSSLLAPPSPFGGLPPLPP